MIEFDIIFKIVWSCFSSKNNKLFQITTLDNYQGKLVEKMGVGTTENEVLEAEPSFAYDGLW